MVRTSPLWLLALACLATAVPASPSATPPNPLPDVTIHGEVGGAEDLFGWSVAPAGDVNDDGSLDIVAGAPSNDHVAGFAGRAYLFLGPFANGSIDAEDADAIINAEAFGDNLGISVAGAGDVNGDGFDDLVVGARSHDEPGIQSGRAYLFHGPMNGVLGRAQADAVISGIAFEELGITVASGDVNGDGRGDLLMGAHQYGSSQGRVYLFYGPVQGARSSVSADAIVTGVLSSDFLGSALTTADVNGDGIDDVVIGAPHAPIEISSPGFAYVFFGPLAGEQSAGAADVVVRGEVENDRFGISASAGDVNGDDDLDLVVGADDIHAHTPGKAYLFLGPLSGDRFAAQADAELTGEAPDDVFGCAVAANGDANGDGRADLIVGAWDNQAGGGRAGRAYIFLGPFSGPIAAGAADKILTGGQAGDCLGAAVAWVGDVNGSGRSDPFIGAPQFPDGAPGEAYLYFDADVPAGVETSDPLSSAYRLFAPAPNPASGSMWIRYEAPAGTPVRLAIFDARGRLVRRLLDGNAASSGRGVRWDGRSDDKARLPSGIYLCRLEAGGQILERKITRLTR